MKKRRTILKVLLLLAAGATLNVAVAWGCAITYIGVSIQLPFTSAQQFWKNNAGVDFPPCQPMNVRFRARTGADHRSMGTFTFENNASDYTYYSVTRNDFGVPVRSLYATKLTVQTVRAGASTMRTDFVGNLPVAGKLGQMLSESYGLPIGVNLPGFAINTLFYGGVLWVVFAGPFALRRMIRRRRGQCAQCTYPIGTSEICTECGVPHAVMPAKAGIQ